MRGFRERGQAMMQEKTYYQRLFSLICTLRRIAADQIKNARKYALKGDTKTEAYFMLKARETRREAREWIAYARRWQPVSADNQDQRIAA
jgi:hypothetical protein